jgi:predicted phosphodiesterase
VRRTVALAAVAALFFACGLFEQEPPGNGAIAVPTSGTGSTLRFAVIGDFGSGLSFERDVARRMCSWRKDHPFDLVITTGDNVYPDGASARFEKKFFEPMSCLLDNEVQFHAVLGNHDIIRLQGRAQIHHPAFGMEGRNYVVRENGVRFVMADSNRPVDHEWLRRATHAQPEDRWTIVVFHHPVHSPAVQHGPSPWLQDMPDLFERRGVDLVLNGHDHLYAVTRPMKKIRYVVTGGGGATLYDCAPSTVTEVCTERHHFLYVVAKEDEISVRAVPISGVPFDRFSTAGHSGS